MTYATAVPIPRLTAYRGYAALAIVWFHMAIAFDLGVGTVHRAELLKVAVTFFFVLSGFVLTHAGAFDSAAAFWRARAARIVPLYVVAWILVLAGRSWLHWIPSQTELLSSLLLVQAWVPDPRLAMSVNPVGWSLSCEAACYLALPLLAPAILRLEPRGLRAASWAVGGWLVAGALLTLVTPIEWWVGYRAAEFAAGVLLAAWLRHGWRPGAPAAALAGVSGLALSAALVLALRMPVPIASLLVMPAFVFLVADAATRNTRPSAWGRPAQLLGRWSYALYLTHWIVVVLISRFGSEAWRVLLAATLSVAVAAVLCELVERPAQRRLVTWARSPSNDRAPAASLAASKDANLEPI
jgi:peptidoglycan/LPS O-acetylase OafA/YrhL